MQTLENPAIRPALVEGEQTYSSITETIAKPVEAKAPRWWQIGMLGTLSLIAVFLGSIGWLWWDGVGVWGLNNPVFWAFDIINMVFWVGIAHTGTAVTSFLTLSRQNWKNGINRIAEAMTIFSVSCAALFPVIHEGRSWMLHYFMPYPNQMWMWPNFKSPIFADVWALQAYLYVSAVFWYIGMIPDIAALRDRAKNKIAAWTYGVLALGWRSSARHWNHYERAYLIMAGIGTPLVLSVCAIVSMSFAPSVIPGWHATIFPVYFLFGALGAGFACLVLLTVFTRKVFGFEKIITEKHLDLLNKCTLACMSGVAYVYLMEITIALYSGNQYEVFTLIINRLTGPYWPIYAVMIGGNVVAAQMLWFKKFRTSIMAMVIISSLITCAMWCERFVIIAMSVHRDFLPGSWGMYYPTFIEIATFAGTIGIFLTLFLAFLKFLPSVAMAEVKTLLSGSKGSH